MSNTYKDKNKLTATKVGEELYGEMDIPDGLARHWGAQELALKKIEKEQEIRHEEQDTEEYYNKMIVDAEQVHEQGQQVEVQPGTKIFVNEESSDSFDLPVHEVPPVVQEKIGEIATRR